MKHRFQVGVSAGQFHFDNLAGRGLQELFQLNRPLFTELLDGPAAQFPVNPFLVYALPHIYSLGHRA